MEQTNNSSEESRRTLSKDPQYFGGYLNMARHNVYNINNHLANEFKVTELEEDGQIPNSFLGNKTKKQNWIHVYSKTVRFMPVVKVFNPERYPKGLQAEPTGDWTGKMCKTLKLLFKELQDFRNDYTHYWSTTQGTQRKIEVLPGVADFLSKSFRLAIGYTKERMKDVFVEADYSLAEQMKMTEPDNRITTEGLAFLISMFLTREEAFLFIGKVKGLKGTIYNSFLATREVLMTYCVKLPHKKLVSEDNKQALMMDIVNHLNRCPRTLYNVITEEGRKEFQPTLTLEKEKNILENSSNRPIDEEDYNDYIESLTTRIRHTNRFPYFALRFIDENELFKNWYFQLELGKIELANYGKQFAGKEEERRIVENVRAFGRLSDWMDEGTVLAKMNFGGCCFEQFAPHYNISNNKIALRKNKDKGRLLQKPDTENQVKRNLYQPSPQAFLSIHELPKVILLEYLSPGATENLIEGFVDNCEKLLTEEFIKTIKDSLPKWDELQRYSEPVKKKAIKEEVKEAKERDLRKLQSRKQQLDEVLKKHSLDSKQIPTRILDYWLNIVDVKDNVVFSDRIKQMRLDCKQRLKDLARHSLDSNVRIPKTGEMATFLARDIVDMLIDKDKKQKMTSFYYDKLQQCIALLADPEKKKELLTLVAELELDKENIHPFLGKLNLRKFDRTSQFYRSYLEEKGKKEIIKSVFSPKWNKNVPTKKDVSWMETTFYSVEWNEKLRKKMTVVKMPEDTSQIPVSIKKWVNKNHELKDWLKHVMPSKETLKVKRKPIDLPTNLFDSQLMNLLREDLQRKDISYDSSANLNELMKLWWATREDGTQAFYQSKREYTIYNQIVRFDLKQSGKFADYYSAALEAALKELKQERDAKNKELRAANARTLPCFDRKQVEQVFKRTIAGTEKEIRILQEEDRMAFLIVEQLLDKYDKKTKLSKVADLLNEMVEGGFTTSSGKKIVFEGKRKNHSLLRKYAFDRRLPELLGYFPEQEIPLSILQKELQAYEVARQKVFDCVFKLEEKIISKEENRQEVEALFVDENGNKREINLQHAPYLKWLINKSLISEEEEQFLGEVRRKFSHNQFPQQSNVTKVLATGREPNLAIATQIVEHYFMRVQKLIEKIEYFNEN